eukprot:5511213-Prymnesium_polylepis.2
MIETNTGNYSVCCLSSRMESLHLARHDATHDSSQVVVKSRTPWSSRRERRDSSRVCQTKPRYVGLPLERGGIEKLGRKNWNWVLEPTRPSLRASL